MNEDEVIMRFMANLPSPTYEFAWLTDWFGIFIKQASSNSIKDEERRKV